MKGQTIILISAAAANIVGWVLLLAFLFSLSAPSVRSIIRDLAPPRAARCIAAESHGMRQACIVGLRATALNGRHLSGATCHGDLGMPCVRLLG